MRKLAYQHGSDIQAKTHRRRWPLVLMVLFLMVGLGPLAMEGAALCLGNWKEFMGVSTDVRTPVLDQVQESLQAMNSAFWLWVSPCFQHVPWEPTMVLPAGTIVMAIAMFMLRR